ncbi:MAG: STT3 domain-containing protein [Candidatus Methanomethylicia archaeon]
MVKAIIKGIGGRHIKTIIKTVTLTLILILAVWIRILPYIKYGPYLSGYDPYFQYRVTQYIVDNGLTSWFTWYDNMSWYPRGRDIPSTSYLGVPLTASITYNLARILGFEIPLMEFCTIFPAIIGGITVLIVYLIGREIDGDGAGLISAILLATVPAFLPRTTAELFDNENTGFISLT